jgi:indolepyruvate ferredoxin oxidoreductase alpha subunit
MHGGKANLAGRQRDIATQAFGGDLTSKSAIAGFQQASRGINPAEEEMERSFKHEVQALRLGVGDIFHGEGILAVTKALLQSGVSYVSGYPGAPVSHLVDVLNDASDVLEDLGVHFEPAANEAGAAAMLGASIQYPIRGAVTWKSVVGTNVASDALSNLASAGVTGGALIIVGEDYGEGASIIQERTHAFAMKSQVWLLDPRPDLPTIVGMVEHGFALSEASNTPVMLELRIRACHMHGSFICKDNQAPIHSRDNPIDTPARDSTRFCLPPWTYAQEKQKVDIRWPAAALYFAEQTINVVRAGDHGEIGIIVQGGLYNGVMRSLQRLGLADAYGAAKIPLYVLNVAYPLVPSEIIDFCGGKKAVLMVEEGQPNYLEQAMGAVLQKHGLTSTAVHGKDVLPAAGEYTGEVLVTGIATFLAAAWPQGDHAGQSVVDEIKHAKDDAARLLKQPVPVRPPGFCVGCPERPVFSAIKIAEKQIGTTHVTGDVGCHIFASLAPFHIGNTMLGYGLGLASGAGVAANFKKRVINIMGDGGFWHNGLTTGVTSAIANGGDGILIIMKNGYAAATGGQRIPTSPGGGLRGPAEQPRIDTVLRSVGVKWLKTIRSYTVSSMLKALVEASTTPERGLKVIIADGECQLARQRRIRPQIAKRLGEGKRVVRSRFGVDADTCTGDHSCIRLSGCPSLTIAPNPDPLCKDPVAKVDNNCVGCGLCGEVAHAAVLCPSFYRADIIQNPTRWDRWVDRVRRFVIGALQTPAHRATTTVP